MVQTLLQLRDNNLRRLPELARDFAREYPDVIDPAGAEQYISSVIHYSLGLREKESMAHFHKLRCDLDDSLDRNWSPRFFPEVS